MTGLVIRVLDLLVCQHLAPIREHAADGWRFRCWRCGRSVRMLDRADLAPPVPKFIGYDPAKARGGAARATGAPAREPIPVRVRLEAP